MITSFRWRCFETESPRSSEGGHGVGIQPTIPVRRTIKGIAEGRDELLERAIEATSR